MNHVEVALARRYALALLKVCGDQFIQEDLSAMQCAIQFFKTHKTALFFLQLPDLPVQTKKKIIKDLFEAVKLPGCFHDLARLLGLHRRLGLLPAVLEQIGSIYQEQHNTMDIKIESSVPLSEAQVDIIRQFFARKSAKTIHATQALNPDLIAGIRARSDILLWEYSVRKKLRAIRLSVIR